MAFASAIVGRDNSDSKVIRWGTFTNDSSSTGGDINTGLKMCESIMLTHTGSAVIASAPVVDETLPAAGSAITIVTTADACGYWEAKGY